MTQLTEVEIHGEVASGFEGVREAFAENFTQRSELGASVAVVRGGEVLVNLWAGWVDAEHTGRWQADTLTNVWSATKGLVATCAHMLVDQGELDLDTPVARYWPEFAAAGKAAIPVRWLLSHRAGLPGVDAPLTVADLLDWEKVTALLAAQRPMWEPGTANGYHAMSFGYLVGEVIRRVSGQSVGTFLAERVAGPLGADLHIGVPAERLPDCSLLRGPRTPAELQAALNAALAKHPASAAAFVNPASGAEDANKDDWRLAQIPAGNGHATALGLATLYGALADGSERILSVAAVEAARCPQHRSRDVVLGRDSVYALGFVPNADNRSFGPSPASFGHDGYGGSSGCADPQTGIGFGYVMNQMNPVVRDDPRKMALLAAVHTCLEKENA